MASAKVTLEPIGMRVVTEVSHWISIVGDLAKPNHQSSIVSLRRVSLSLVSAVISVSLLSGWSFLSDTPVTQESLPTQVSTPQVTSKNFPKLTLTPILNKSLALQTQQKSRDASLIRVGLSDNSMKSQSYPRMTLSCSGAFRGIDTSSGKVVLNGKPWQQVRVAVNPSGFRLMDSIGRVLKQGITGPVRFEPLNTSKHRMRVPSLLRRRRIPSYRGVLIVERAKPLMTKLTVINELPMQDYLKAVVPNELPMRFGLSAVKAQSVAARNYAIRPRERPWDNFDICDSQYCQAYYGAQTETSGTTNAIASTTGLVALHQGEPILALYSSSHGGHSESYENAFSEPKTNQFPGIPLPYLTGHPDVAGGYGDLSTEKAARYFWTHRIKSYDTASSYYRWSKRWTRWQLQTQLNKSLREISDEKFTQPFIKPLFRPGQRIGELQGLTVLKRGKSGKAMTLRIDGTSGSWTLQKEFVIRKALKHRGRMLPSANFVLDKSTSSNGKLLSLTARGGGFGHGVGMSQYGASAMSKRGYHYSKILQHYYRGASIGTIPISIQNNPAQLNPAPEQLSFYVKQPSGTLYVKNATPGKPITISLNGQFHQVNLGNASNGSVLVNHLLKPNRLNKLTVYPQAGQSLKTWIELYPGK